MLCRCVVAAAGWCASAGLAAGQGSLFDGGVAGTASATSAPSAPAVEIGVPQVDAAASGTAAASGVSRSGMPDPQQLLAGSARMIARQKSIVAKVRHRATIYDRELIGYTYLDRE